MTTEKMDFSGYSKEQLLDSFEGVDDQKYPENALEIYTLLQSKSESVSTLIEDRYSESSGLLKTIAGFIFFPFFTDTALKRSDMQEKRLRVKKRTVDQ